MSLLSDVLLLNGPNLNRLGRREPHLYGIEDLATVEASLQAKVSLWPGWQLTCIQSNHEGALIDAIQAFEDSTAASRKTIIINAGGLTHTSISLRDALAAFIASEKSTRDVIEVHLSNIYAREAYRHHSYISPVATGVICGLGVQGYHLALEFAFKKMGSQPSASCPPPHSASREPETPRRKT
ncbi:MAG: type II 3-dehydroquinate dehydratase [Vampirovibrionales bacterium]|nr:type II 3-dehydroquinate dehydratase [Vampirovibrionales bacterium]